jgi:NAD(P)-dependent dehydrogenase (short-subunit alcohol dehydrogenase family)
MLALAPPCQESQDGYELRFAGNYLAPFLLTRLLLPTLRQSAPVRIVNLASAGQAPIDFGDVMLSRRYDGVQAYCQSKLALVMFTFDLAEGLASTEVTANYMPTKMVLAARESGVSSIEEGVQATTHLITAPELNQVTGRYYNGLREARAESQAYDRQARCQLRQLYEHLTGVTGS